MNTLIGWYGASKLQKRFLIAVTAFSLVLGLAGTLIAPTNTAYADSTLSLTCDSVEVDGDTWTLSGTWKAYDFPGQSDAYDVAVFSPSGISVDNTSSDSPDTFVTTLGPAQYAGHHGSQDDMEGTWSNQIIFASNPTEIFASLYHAAIPGNEQSGDATCSFVLPPQVAHLTLEKTVIADNGGTALDTDWTLQATNGGDTTISGAEGAPAVTNAEVPSGTYILSESGGPTGYTNQGWLCDGGDLSGNSLTLSTGDDVTCTVTNNDQPGTLVVVKELPNDNGGTADESDFSFQVNAGEPITFNTNGQNTLTVDAGTYTVTEVGAPFDEYDTSYGNCENVAVANGETETCTITNDDIAPSLTVVKVVENDDETRAGTKNEDDFDLFVGITQVVREIANFFTAGTYTVSEQNAGGYNATFSGDCASNGSITLELGGDYTCTITNNDKAPGILTVIKHVVNDNPEGFTGTASAPDFTIEVTGGNPDPSSFAGSEDGVPVIIDAGASYSVLETNGPSGYHVSYSGACEGIMPEGGEATCTITNNDNDPTQSYLTVVKHVVNDNGGTASASTWTLQVAQGENDPETVVNGEANLVDADDTYTISEISGAFGYGQTSITCSDNGGSAVETSSITAEAGHSYVCTITNDDIAPSLTIQKVLDINYGGTASTDEWTVGASGPSILSGAGSVSSGGTFQAGTYTLSETGGPATGYTEGDWSCTNDVSVGDGNTITLGVGEETVCTITNYDEPATLIVIKHVINDNGGDYDAGEFTIYVDGTDVSESSFPGDEEGTTVTLDAGSYSVSEDGPDGYGATLSEDCSGTIGNGETKTCTITNDDGKATLTIEKYTNGADGTFTFTVTGQEDVVLETVEGSDSTDLALDAGTYNVVELVPAGWTLLGGEDAPYCDYDGGGEGDFEIQPENGVTVLLDVGDHVTCEFYNTATGADVSVEKSVDDETPDVGQTITYTLTVTNSGPGDVNDDVQVTDVLPSGLTYVSDDGEGAYATSTGAWNVGPLASGASKTLAITVTVNEGTEGETIVNTASVSFSDEEVSDYDESNDGDDISVTVTTPEPEPETPTPPPGGGGNGSPFLGAVNGGGGAVLGAFTSTGGQVLGETCGLYLGQYLRRGNPKNSADQVTKLQEFLNKYNFGSFTPTGYFGPLTEAAVKAFQNQYASAILAPWNLSSPTGLAYLTTIRQLNLLECPDLSLEIPELVPWSQNPAVQ